MTHLKTPPAPPKPSLLLQDALAIVKTGEPVVFDGKDGKPVAALITIEDLRFYEKLFAEEEDRVDIAACEEAREEIASGRVKTIPWEQVKAELGL